MNKLQKTLIAMVTSVVGFALNRHMGLPGPGPVLSLVIVYISFINGRKIGLWFTGFVLFFEIMAFMPGGLTHQEMYSICMLVIAQPLMAVLVGNLKNSHAEQQKEIVGSLTYKADVYRRYFDSMMAAVPLIANYPSVSIIDKDGNYVAVNEDFTYTYGYAEDEVVGKKWYLAINREDINMAQELYEEMISSGVSKTARYRGVTKNGESFMKEVMLIMCRDKEGRFVGHLKLEKKLNLNNR
jgi:PAS domain S-box-containing protein